MGRRNPHHVASTKASHLGANHLLQHPFSIATLVGIAATFARKKGGYISCINSPLAEEIWPKSGKSGKAG